MATTEHRHPMPDAPAPRRDDVAPRRDDVAPRRDDVAPRRDDAARRRARSVRMALALASIALVFFLGVLFSRRLGGISVVMTTAGFVLMAILALIILMGSKR